MGFFSSKERKERRGICSPRKKPESSRQSSGIVANFGVKGHEEEKVRPVRLFLVVAVRAEMGKRARVGRGLTLDLCDCRPQALMGGLAHFLPRLSPVGRQ